MRKPYFNQQRQCWYVWIDGKQVRLFDEKDASFDLWHKLVSTPTVTDPDPLFAVVVDAYLVRAKRQLAESTFDGYSRILLDACKAMGRMPLSRLAPRHIADWLHSHPRWGAASQRAGITAVKICLNWAVDESLIARNPIRAMKRPKPTRRDVTISDQDHRRATEATDKHFRLLLVALRHSGCRPGEVARISKQNCRTPGFWQLGQHKTAGSTGAARIIPLSPCLVTITAILCAARPSGALFLNRLGKPWTPNAVRCRMRRLRQTLTLPAGTVAYSYRHTFCTEGLTNGVDLATMATMLGHTSPTTLMRHYAHLGQKTKHLQEAAAKAAISRSPTE